MSTYAIYFVLMVFFAVKDPGVPQSAETPNAAVATSQMASTEQQK